MTINVIFLCTSFLFGGLICYFHWEAMLISHVASRVAPMPFNNMQELYDSDYNFMTPPGTSYWDSFKYGNSLWQRLYKDKLEPFGEEYKLKKFTIKKWLLSNEKNAAYGLWKSFA